MQAAVTRGVDLTSNVTGHPVAFACLSTSGRAHTRLRNESEQVLKEARRADEKMVRNGASFP